MPGFVSWVLGIVRWVLGFVFWVLGFVFWVLGFVFWVSGFVFWVSGFVFWVSWILTRVTRPKGAKTHTVSNIWPLARPNIAKVGKGRLKMGGDCLKMGEG